MVKGKGKRAEMEGFKNSVDAPYNWDADKGQRTIIGYDAPGLSLTTFVVPL